MFALPLSPQDSEVHGGCPLSRRLFSLIAVTIELRVLCGAIGIVYVQCLLALSATFDYPESISTPASQISDHHTVPSAIRLSLPHLVLVRTTPPVGVDVVRLHSNFPPAQVRTFLLYCALSDTDAPLHPRSVQAKFSSPFRVSSILPTCGMVALCLVQRTNTRCIGCWWNALLIAVSLLGSTSLSWRFLIEHRCSTLVRLHRHSPLCGSVDKARCFKPTPSLGWDPHPSGMNAMHRPPLCTDAALRTRRLFALPMALTGGCTSTSKTISRSLVLLECFPR